MARLIAEDPDALDSVEWRDLERTVALVLDQLGFEAELTPPSKDGGKDIILKMRDRTGALMKYLVEIKHWRSGKTVGDGVVKYFVQVVAKEDSDGGLMLATYGFTPDACASLTEAERAVVRLGAKTKIVALCRSYVKAEAGLWAPIDGGLPEILFDHTA